MERGPAMAVANLKWEGWERINREGNSQAQKYPSSASQTQCPSHGAHSLRQDLAQETLASTERVKRRMYWLSRAQ